MPINAEYRGPGELPEIVPVCPLPGALLLPRGQMPLNIFEPRYLAMVDDALRDGHRLIGMIQPDISHSRDEAKPELFRVGCVGRITQLAESGDGRYILELTGVARFKVLEEITALTAYRQCKVDFFPYADDLDGIAGDRVQGPRAEWEARCDGSAGGAGSGGGKCPIPPRWSCGARCTGHLVGLVCAAGFPPRMRHVRPLWRLGPQVSKVAPCAALFTWASAYPPQ